MTVIIKAVSIMTTPRCRRLRAFPDPGTTLMVPDFSPCLVKMRLIVLYLKTAIASPLRLSHLRSFARRGMRRKARHPSSCSYQNRRDLSNNRKARRCFSQKPELLRRLSLRLRLCRFRLFGFVGFRRRNISARRSDQGRQCRRSQIRRIHCRTDICVSRLFIAS